MAHANDEHRRLILDQFTRQAVPFSDIRDHSPTSTVSSWSKCCKGRFPTLATLTACASCSTTIWKRTVLASGLTARTAKSILPIPSPSSLVACSAKPDSCCAPGTGTLTFAPGETTKTFTIEVNGDCKKEANETFYLDLFGNQSNSLFSKSRGTGTILNDD